MLRHRLLFGSIMIVALGAALYGDASWSGAAAPTAPGILRDMLGVVTMEGLPVVIVMAIIVALGAPEMSRLCRATGNIPVTAWTAIVSVALVCIPFVAANGVKTSEDSLALTDMRCTVATLAFGILGTGFLVMRRKKTEGATGAIASTLLVFMYLGLLGQFIVRIRMFGPAGATWLLLYFLASVKVCDIGAYFTGMAIGKHKMIEWLSPKKTWQGLAGGVAASVAVAVLTPVLVDQFAAESSVLRGLFPGLGKAAVFGLLMALVGQGGDLVESLFKRDAKAKDSANAIPAFGGVLDVVDSPLWAAPVAWWLLLH